MAQKLDVGRMMVASPCRVGWDSMIGDDRARFCGSCDRQVYNIVGLSRSEIETLVENTEGRLCVRMYQRADATVLTADCPVGLRLIRKRVATFAGAALSALLGLVSVGFGQKPEDCLDSRTKVVDRVKIDSQGGEIFGLIVDMNGAVVPGIDIKLRLEKRLVAKVRSDTEGNFTIPDIDPSEKYSLRVEGQQGWKKQSIEGIKVNSGEKLSYSLCLQPDTVYEVVGLYGQPSEFSPDGINVTDRTFIHKQTQPVPITSTQTSKPTPTPKQPEK